MSDHNNEMAEGFFVFPIFLVIYVLTWLFFSFINGFAIMKLWGWFVIPLFSSAPSLGLWQAVGLSMLCRMITGGGGAEAQYKNHELMLGRTLSNGCLRPGLALVFG